MKKIFKSFIVVAAVFSVIGSATFCAYRLITADAVLREEKLTKYGTQITFYDSNSEKIIASDGFGNASVSTNELPSYVGNAFIAVEDKRFYSHGGIDLRALARAALSDMKSRSLKEGGSTISQQLVKNTHLSNEKTIIRKLKEARLVEQLEKRYSKKQILDFYLNGIYFGNGAYGVENAANKYFSKSARDLTLSEAAALAATVKSPAKYNPSADNEKRKNLVLKLMLEQNMITREEYERAKAQKIEVKLAEKNDYFTLAKEELYSICDISPYETRPISVYTYFDKKAQDALSSLDEQTGEIRKNGLIASRYGHIKAVCFPYGDEYCMPASTIKPLLVYAPAFNEGVISPATPIDDTPTDFGGYSPKNFGDAYHGYISAKDCIVKSLNVPAVKVFNAVGAEKCLSYAEKLGLEINEKTPNVALGGLSKGIKFTNLCAAYTVFQNGVYYPPKFIKSVAIGGLSAYSANDDGIKTFKSGTADLINDALKECTKSGTAKALSDFEFDLCAKTGTNGTENGNTDALTVCYTSEDVIGVRLYPKDGLLPCSVTGGAAARETAEIIRRLYSVHTPSPIKRSDETQKVRLCRLAYSDCKLLLAPEEQPDKYCVSAMFLKEYTPTEFSEEFVKPGISAEIRKNNNDVTILLDKKTAIGAEIFRESEYEEKIADTYENEYVDEKLKDGKYRYCVLPYAVGLEGKKYYGEKVYLAEIFVGEKQKFASGEDWFDD